MLRIQPTIGTHPSAIMTTQASAEPQKQHSEHKHEGEKTFDMGRKREGGAPPHAHGDYQKG